MAHFKVYMDWSEPYYKGDFIELPCVIVRDTTDCKFRASLKDEYFSEVKLASDGVQGGSSDQITVTQSSGDAFDFFTIKVPFGQTTCFGNITIVEVELEDEAGHRSVILQRRLDLRDKNINWDEPNV